jgi:phosphotransferase system enzyme I (PtsI)
VLARQFDEMEDEYLRERKADLEQVAERVLRCAGQGGIARPRSAGPIAPTFGGEEPAGAGGQRHRAGRHAAVQAQRVQGISSPTWVGAPRTRPSWRAAWTSPPWSVRARPAGLIRQDDWIIIDGDAGVVIVDPHAHRAGGVPVPPTQSELERARLDRLRHTPAVTLDGQAVELLANIEMPDDAVVALEAGAVGVGLFRSEFLFMNRGGDLPDEDEQFEAYRSAVEAMKGLPVTIRTVDIGADKPLERMSRA